MTTPSKLDVPEILTSIFFPRKEIRTALPQACSDLDISLSENELLSCRLHESDRKAPLIIYFHGNGETVSDYDYVAQTYTGVGLNILIASYRGYGWSSGEPTVSALFHDNVKIYDFIRNYCDRNGFTGPFFVMGRSLGSASAIDLAFRFPEMIKGLIIESGFADSLPLIRRLGCNISGKDITEKDCFNNLSKIRKITMPTLILHGAADDLIPLAEAEKLQVESGARTKQFQIIPGADHNSLIAIAGDLYFETIKTFTNSIIGINTWRKRREQFKKKQKEQ